MGVFTTGTLIEKMFTYIGMGILYLLTSILVVLRNVIKGIHLGVLYSIIFTVNIMGKIYSFGKLNYGICEVCFTKYQSPIYECPNCKIGYHSLCPSVKGILSIKCSCGQKLPVTTWGRGKLKTLCPECKSQVALTTIPIIVIPVIGGIAAGKTTFINNILELESQRVENTTNFLRNSNGKTTKVMLFDTLGSDFSDSDILKNNKYYSYNDGLIFIVDPFATAKLSKEIDKTPNYMLSDILDTLILNFQKNQGLKPGETIKKPIAFVISKVDLLDRSKGKLENEEEKFLLENGEEMFLNKIKRTFECYKFFTLGEKNSSQSRRILNFVTTGNTISKH